MKRPKQPVLTVYHLHTMPMMAERLEENIAKVERTLQRTTRHASADALREMKEFLHTAMLLIADGGQRERCLALTQAINARFK